MSERSASPVKPPSTTPVVVQVFGIEASGGAGAWAWVATDDDWEAGVSPDASAAANALTAVQAALVAIPAALPLVLSAPAELVDVLRRLSGTARETAATGLDLPADAGVGSGDASGVDPALLADVADRLRERQVDVRQADGEADGTGPRARARAARSEPDEERRGRQGPGFSLNPAG